MGVAAIERATGDMAPKSLAIGTFHDAVVAVETLGIENWGHALALALVLFQAGVEQ